MNSTVSLAVWPGFKVSGNETPDTLKAAPVTVAALTVTGASPLDHKTRDCFAVALTATLPNAMLVALGLRIGNEAFNRRVKCSETSPALAVNVAHCTLATHDAVAVNVALVASAGTVTVVGTDTAALLLARLTLRPPLGAAPVSVTMQASVADPVMDQLVQNSPSSFGVGLRAVPVPVRLIAARGLVELLLVTVN